MLYEMCVRWKVETKDYVDQIMMMMPLSGDGIFMEVPFGVICFFWSWITSRPSLSIFTFVAVMKWTLKLLFTVALLHEIYLPS